MNDLENITSNGKLDHFHNLIKKNPLNLSKQDMSNYRTLQRRKHVENHAVKTKGATTDYKGSLEEKVIDTETILSKNPFNVDAIEHIGRELLKEEKYGMAMFYLEDALDILISRLPYPGIKRSLILLKGERKRIIKTIDSLIKTYKAVGESDKIDEILSQNAQFYTEKELRERNPSGSFLFNSAA